MKLVSFGQCSFLGDADIENLNSSDIIIIPDKIRTPTKDKPYANYCIQNKAGQTAYVSCLTTHNRDEVTILCPQWVHNKLTRDTSSVVLKTCKVEKATRMSIRLFTKEKLSDADLQKALSKYILVQANSIITLSYRGREIHAKIESTEPNKEFVTLRDTDVFIEFLENVDTFLPFYGKKANVLGGTKPEGKKPVELALEAAVKRLAQEPVLPQANEPTEPKKQDTRRQLALDAALKRLAQEPALPQAIEPIEPKKQDTRRQLALEAALKRIVQEKKD
jgi:hypothetical protein